MGLLGSTASGAMLAGDLNEDGIVDIVDLNMILIDWGKSVPNLANPDSDADGSGTIDIVDLNVVLIDWGKVTYTLTVTSGSGSGDYTPEAVVSISAEAAPSGQSFDAWVGDTDQVSDTAAASTTITMPASHANITATYVTSGYTLIVNGGSGDGVYDQAAAVAITADPAPSGYVFDVWTGDVAYIDNINSHNAIVIMPANDVVVIATWLQVSGSTQTVIFGRGGAAGYGPDTADDVRIGFSQWNNLTGNGSTEYAHFGNEGTNGGVVLMGFKDMFNLLSPTSDGKSLLIESASLELLTQVTSGAGSLVEINGMLTNWLVQAAGTNETNVHSDKCDIAGDVSWNGPDNFWSWGSDDYSSQNAAVETWTGGWNALNTFDITDLLQDAYDANENFGWVIRNTTGSAFGGIRIDQSESGGTNTPKLTIEYSYEATALYTLTVNSGIGGGDYLAGTLIPISADVSSGGRLFKAWSGDTATVENINAAETTVLISAGDVTLTATYGDIYTLTVISGLGSGDHAESAIVPITANTPPEGMAFDVWTGDIGGIANISEAVTSITMPDSDVMITATYFDMPIYPLTVISGDGDGDHWEGKLVPISADLPIAGLAFSAWTGDTGGVSNIDDPNTIFTMPAAAATITATYETGYSLTVISGLGSGMYKSGKSVSISADPAPTDMTFYQWTGDTSSIGDTYLADTTLTMPSLNITVTTTYQTVIPLSGPAMLDIVGGYYRLAQDIEAPDTAFFIFADGITLDLAGYTVTYDTTPGGRCWGVYVAGGVDGVTIKNGTIVQGAAGTEKSGAIYVYGNAAAFSPYEFHHLVIHTYGDYSPGISAEYRWGFNNSSIHHTYVACDAFTDRTDGSGGDCISIQATDAGNVSIHDNILVGGHRGMQCAYLGYALANPGQSSIYNNLIQQTRSLEGSKAPYGILLARSRNVHVYNNQIITDHGRGIMLDGWDQGVPQGTDYCQVYDNRIDVQYTNMSTGGSYPEDRVYGIRDRYSSGNNAFENNILMVTNEVPSSLETRVNYAFYIGSDALDGLMENIVVQDNTIFVRDGASGVSMSAFYFGHAESVSVINNQYQTAGSFSTVNGYVVDLVLSGNTVFTPPASTPAAPNGLRLTKFLNDYLLQWDDNSEADVYEYRVYRDGTPLPISTRGGTFYVDRNVTGTHDYSVTAVTLTGSQSLQCAPVSSTTAANAWW